MCSARVESVVANYDVDAQQSRVVYYHHAITTATVQRHLQVRFVLSISLTCGHSDGVMNGLETQIDCGGNCKACVDAPSPTTTTSRYVGACV
jgi:hypothetical protein